MARTGSKGTRSRSSSGAQARNQHTPAPQARPGTSPPAPLPVPAPELLDLDQAIARLKTTRPTFYRWLRSGRLKGMKVGRQWRFYASDIERFLQGQGPRVDLPVAIAPLLDALRARLRAAGAAEPARNGAEPVAHAVNQMIRLGEALRASDLHLEVDLAGQVRAARLRYRIDGVLHPAASFDLRLLPAVIEQWKRLAACDPQEKATAQDGRVRLETDRGRLDLLVSFLPAFLGEALVARFLPAVLEVQLALDQLGYAPRDLARIQRWVRAPWGLVVVTGPTGCGKTTTAYACLNQAARPEVKVLSAESPVEYVLPGVVQVQVNEHAGLTFARLVRGMLRCDPDILLVGEIRDRESLQLTLSAALTGHLVFTILHAEDAATALQRMVDVGTDPYVVADAAKLIVAQRLVRRLCADCAVPETPDARHLADARALLAGVGGLDWDALPHSWRKAVGCDRCGATGYRGRLVVAETLEVTPEIAAALRRGAALDELRAIALRQGTVPLAAHAVERAAAGETGLNEVLALAGRP